MFGLNILGAMGVWLYITLLLVFVVSVILSGCKDIVKTYWSGKMQLFVVMTEARQHQTEEEETPVA